MIHDRNNLDVGLGILGSIAELVFLSLLVVLFSPVLLPAWAIGAAYNRWLR